VRREKREWGTGNRKLNLKNYLIPSEARDLLS